MSRLYSGVTNSIASTSRDGVLEGARFRRVVAVEIPVVKRQVT